MKFNNFYREDGEVWVVTKRYINGYTSVRFDRWLKQFLIDSVFPTLVMIFIFVLGFTYGRFT